MIQNRPIVPLEVQQAVLTAVLRCTGNRAEFDRRRKAYKNALKDFRRKRSEFDHEAGTSKSISNFNEPEPEAPHLHDFQWPEGCIAGINAVTNLLEEQIGSTKERTFQTQTGKNSEAEQGCSFRFMSCMVDLI